MVHMRTRGYRLLSCVSILLGLFSAAAPVGQAQPALPPQPTAVAAFHRSGQTFVTWTERDDMTGEHYRVYRGRQPITADSLAQANLLYEVAEGSGRFFADRYNMNWSGVWAPRYLERYVIADGGTQLAPGTGLLVWTLAADDLDGETAGVGYYAVTTVANSGVENRDELGVANLSGPVSEGVAEPLPVKVATGAGGLAHIYTQFMDLRNWNPTFNAPRSGNSYYGLSAQMPGVADAIQYAYTYSVHEPDPSRCGGTLPAVLPIAVILHAWEGNTYAPRLSAATYCACEIRPIDVSESWYFGFAREHDYRLGSPFSAGDVVVNYTEQRVLRMVYDLLRDPTLGPRVDRERVYVWGHSMGASGALALALRYPNVFAAAYAGEPMTNYRTSGGWAGDVAQKWGPAGLNLPIEVRGPSDWAVHLLRYDGTGVWDWQDHQANLQSRTGDEAVPLGIGCGLNDTSVPWTTQGQPALAALNASARAWGGVVTNAGHTWLGFAGLPPTLGFGASGAPFWGLRVSRSESVPGLSNGSADRPLTAQETGGYNQTLEWSASWNAWDGTPLDTVAEWRISLRTTDGSDQTVDVTPRRLRVFRITPGAPYDWENRRVEDDTVVASGTLLANGHGLLTIPSFAVSSAGNRLSLQSSGGPTLTPRPTHTPAPTPSATPRARRIWVPILRR